MLVAIYCSSFRRTFRCKWIRVTSASVCEDVLRRLGTSHFLNLGLGPVQLGTAACVKLDVTPQNWQESRIHDLGPSDGPSLLDRTDQDCIQRVAAGGEGGKFHAHGFIPLPASMGYCVLRTEALGRTPEHRRRILEVNINKAPSRPILACGNPQLKFFGRLCTDSRLHPGLQLDITQSPGPNLTACTTNHLQKDSSRQMACMRVAKPQSE